MFRHLEAALLSLITLAAVDRVPEFNIEPICREVAGRADAPHYKETCLRKEREAQEQLRQKWATFRASDRSYCTQLASLGGVPSYVELLTCLDVAQSVGRARGENARQNF
jgi:hypothetical protein